MRSLGIITLVFSLCYAVLASFANESMQADDVNFLWKRWYSVPEYPGKDKAVDPFVYPWPIVCVEPYIQPIHYCFRDARSAKNLEHVVKQAVVKWGHAIDNTALTIELDPRTKGNPSMLCSQLGGDGDKDALVISDESIDDPDIAKQKDQFYSSACQTKATVGYTYEPKVPFRHTLKFCEVAPWNPKADYPTAIRKMTHELGA